MWKNQSEEIDPLPQEKRETATAVVASLPENAEESSGVPQA